MSSKLIENPNDLKTSDFKTIIRFSPEKVKSSIPRELALVLIIFEVAWLSFNLSVVRRRQFIFL